MINAGTWTVLALIAWATLAGMDLVSVPQMMLSRPLVAAGIAGLLLGDPGAGLRVGVVLELFALDVLPVGAVRYPDYGAASVGAAAVSAGAPWEVSLGVSVAVGLLLSVVGGWSLLVLRRINARAVQRRAAALRAGDGGAVRQIHLAAIGRDAVRSLSLAGLALTAAWFAVHYVRIDRVTGSALTMAAAGAGVASALGGALRGAGAGARTRWLSAGCVIGTGVATLAWNLR